MTTPPRRTSPASRATRRSRRPAPRSAPSSSATATGSCGSAARSCSSLLVGMAFVTHAARLRLRDDLRPDAGARRGSRRPRSRRAAARPRRPPVTPPPPGFVQPDMGHVHVPTSARASATRNCPPASGKHYNATSQGPIQAGAVRPGRQGALPEGWIHNLEHGAIVLLYKCPGPAPACTDAGQAALKALLANGRTARSASSRRARSRPSSRASTTCPTPYAALVWDVVLPMQTIDEAALFDFYAGQAERFNPEKLRAPTPTRDPGRDADRRPRRRPRRADRRAARRRRPRPGRRRRRHGAPAGRRADRHDPPDARPGQGRRRGPGCGSGGAAARRSASTTS